MAEENLEVGINVSSNIESVVSKAVRQIDNLTDTLGDLSDLFKDLSKYQSQAEGGMAKVAESAKKIAKSSADAVSDVDKLRSALSKTGDEAREALKELDFSKVSLGKLSAKEIEQLNSLLKEAGSSLGEFLEKGKVDNLQFTNAINQLNELQEIMGRPITPSVDFENASEVFAQLRSLNAELRSDIQETLNQLQIPDSVFTSLGALEAKLGEISSPARTDLNLVAELDQTRAGADALLNRANDLKDALREIGPAAQQGNAEAVSQFVRLSAELQNVNQRADEFTNKLNQTQTQFANYIGQTNQSLQQLKFKPVTLEDVFPSQEQQKIIQLQNRIDNAVRESIEAGAVQNTLNLFLNQNNQISEMDRNVVRLTTHLPRLRYALYDVSNTLGILGGSLSAVSFGVAKVGIDFQRMFADVERTVNAGRDEIRALQGDLVALSQTIPVSFDEITRIATLAGQLNVATGSIAEFTETVAKFVATSDVTVDAAATAFGRLDQLVAGVDGQFEKLGAAISAVGVNAVATESEIIAISSQIASVANIAGFGAGELVGFASALASVGTRPELARGTFTRLFTEISQAVAGTKDTLDDFSRLAGMSATDFQDAWGRGEGPELVINFLKGLQAEGRDAELALRQVGITSVRDVPTLLKLAQGVEEVENQLAIAKIAFIEGTELQRQYSIVASTVAEKLQVLKNSIQALVATVGSGAGALGFLVDIFIGLVNVIQKILDNPINKFIVGLTTAVVGLVGGMGLLLAAVARAGAGFAGLLTATTETSKAIAATRLNVQGLNTDLQTTSATAATAGTSLKTFGGSAISTSPALATANSGISQLVGPNGLPLVTKEAGKATDKMSKGLIPSLFRVGKATKLVPIAAFALKFAAIYAGTLLLIKGIDSLGKRFGLWGKEIENVNSELGDLTPFLSSIKRDTEDFNSGITSAQDGLIFFRGEVKSSSVELSEQGKIIASVTGQQELLEQSVDGSTTAIAKQTLVIGENTLALIKQKVAQDVINDSQGVSIDNVRELIRLNNLLAESSSGSFGVDINTITEARSQVGRRGAEVGVASVFAIVSDPRLNEALKEAGFNVAEFFDLIARGNEEAALSLLSNLVPAAEKTREALLDSGASEAADEIAYLDGIIAFGVQGLSEYTSSGTRLTAAVKELIFQQTLMGDAFEDTSDAVKTFQDAMKNAVDEAYSFVNAQRDMEQAVYRLGEAFAQESPEVVANSREMQAAIKAVLDTASSPEEAIQNLSGFYKSIVDGGYASGESLAILQQFIIDTYNTFAAAQLESLKKTREMILASNEMRRAVGAGMRGITGPAYEQTFQELEDINSQIAITENAIGNIYAIISSSSGPSYTNQLASGFNSVGSAASGAAEQVKTFNDIVRELTSILFAAINAQNAAEEAIFSLGEAFGSSGREALGASREIQTAVTTILETSNSGAEAVANLSGLFGVLSNTAGVSSKDLKILRDVIFEVGRAAGLTDKQIRALLNSFGEGLTTLNFDNFNLGVQSATENLETFQDTIGGFLTDLFSFVNASNAAQNSVFALGQAFGESGDTALYASSEMQSAIGNIVAASGDGREAVANLSALFGTLSNTAGVSRESLNALEQTIYAVGREAGLSDREIRRLINSFGGSEATVSLDNFANGLESVNTQIVTLLDYANQLSGVLSRAFDLRFGTIIQLDAISQSWLDIGDRIDAARKSIRELQILQRDLAADRAIKEYFLTIAEAYGDNLRAAKLREEIADIDERLGESAEDLARAEREASGELAGNTIEAINNRQALIALLGQYQSYITTLAASGASQEELSAAVQEAKDLFIAQATQLGFSEEAVNEYAESFDDMATIIAELPRDVTINLEANANPALTALNEVNAAIQRNTTAALELNAALNLPVAAATPPRPQTSASPGVGSTSGSTSGTSGTSGTPGSGPSAPTAAASSTEKQIDAAKKQRKSLIAERKRLQGMLRGMPAGAPRTAIQGQISSLTAAINQLEVTLRRLGVAPGNFNFAKGGFTGRGGKYDPAGIVHKGEFVVPKEFVNQSTGTPDLAFLAALQNGVRSYAQGGMVGSSVSMPDAMMVELSPYDRKLLQEAGNVQLMLNGRVVAEATNSSNLVSAQRGSN